ncbi:MAG TPA: HAD-IA family hydrolase [Polyangia bacterium]|nr:HAD-IA family hydrolase [Polyangia bacterium]
MALDGVIFDFDGVLVDSNDAHVRAWQRAFQECGYNVEADRIFVEVGKGGDKLVADILGQSAEGKRGDELRALNKQALFEIWASEGLRVIPGGQELLAALRARGIRTALASSSNSEQIEKAEAASRVAWRKLFDQVITASDVEQTKPSPDLVQAAVHKLRMSPAQCAMIGDTPWDARAATAAGVVLLGVTGGGNQPAALRAAGARAVYRDVAAIGAGLDAALRIASPGGARLDAAALDRLLEAARNATGGKPAGCIVADGNAAVIAAFGGACDGHLAHPAIEALRVAGAQLASSPPAGLILAATHEPCPMCVGAAVEAGVDVLLFAQAAPVDHGVSRLLPPSGTRWLLPRTVQRGQTV